MPKIKKTPVAQRLTELLGLLFGEGYSLAAISRVLGVTPQTLNNYVNQGRLPSAEFLMSLAERGAGITWLLTGDGLPMVRHDVDDPNPTSAALQYFSDRAIMAEVEQRFRRTIEDGISLLNEMKTADFRPLVERLKVARHLSELTAADDEAARKVTQAMSLAGRMYSWYPDAGLDPNKRHREFLDLYESVAHNVHVQLAQNLYLTLRIESQKPRHK